MRCHAACAPRQCVRRSIRACVSVRMLLAADGLEASGIGSVVAYWTLVQ